jgi:hypothetical protein
MVLAAQYLCAMDLLMLATSAPGTEQPDADGLSAVSEALTPAY